VATDFGFATGSAAVAISAEPSISPASTAMNLERFPRIVSSLWFGPCAL
jgi:hypothetical protein